MASVRPCDANGQSLYNTGAKCPKVLRQAWLAFFGSTSLVIPKNVVEGGDILGWLQQHVNAVGSQKIYPWGGEGQPLNNTDFAASDPDTYTNPLTKAVRQMSTTAINGALYTTEGGLDLAKAGNAIADSGLGVIVFDNKGGYIVNRLPSGDYSFFPTLSKSFNIIPENLQVPYQNVLKFSISQSLLVNSGSYWIETTGQALQIRGLFDIILDSRAAATSTTVTVGGKEADGTDIYDVYSTTNSGTLLLNPTSWVATKVSDGTTVAISSVAANSGLKAFVLTFTTTPGSAVAVNVKLAPADVLYTNQVIGIDGQTPVKVTTP